MVKNQKHELSKGIWSYPPTSKDEAMDCDEDLCTSNNAAWKQTFIDSWSKVEHKIKELEKESHKAVIGKIVEFVKSCHTVEDSFEQQVIPCAVLLTGINEPDHLAHFTALQKQLKEEVTQHAVLIEGNECPTGKSLIENVVYRLLTSEDHAELLDVEEDEITFTSKKKRFTKSELTISNLESWYLETYGNTTKAHSPKKKSKKQNLTKLVIILPVFESFNCDALQDFVTILSAYRTRLPLVLALGVRTTAAALHRAFPHRVSCNLLLKLFHTRPPPQHLQRVLDEVVLSADCPLQLSARCLNFLTDTFFFYDLSVHNFLAGFKYMMLRHYEDAPHAVRSLCCSRAELKQRISTFSAEDLETVRSLPSFRPYVEGKDYGTQIALLEDDEYFRRVLLEEMEGFHEYLYIFHAMLRLLLVLFKDLPNNELGSSVRELYVRCASTPVAACSAFSASVSLVAMQSRAQLAAALGAGVAALRVPRARPLAASAGAGAQGDNRRDVLAEVRVQLAAFERQVSAASLSASTRGPAKRGDCAAGPGDSAAGSPLLTSRHQLKQSLQVPSKMAPGLVQGQGQVQGGLQSEYAMVCARLREYLREVVQKLLPPPTSRVFHEALVLGAGAGAGVGAGAGAWGTRRQLRAAPARDALAALANPASYLKCSCCKLPEPGAILPSMPDRSVAYKLCAEAGRDVDGARWLGAFAAILRPIHYRQDGGDSDAPDAPDEPDVPDDIKARFRRAVSELEYMGYVKPSRRKQGHYTKLTHLH